MGFKIGDKVKITDGSWSIKLSDEPYNTKGISGIDKIQGIIRAIDCRLPIGPGYEGLSSPIEGMSLSFESGVVVFNDLLVQTEDGYVCTATRHVKRIPEKHKIVIYGVEIDVTKEQSEKLAKVIGARLGSGIYRIS